MKFNEKLLELRKKKGWSQEELGDKLDVSRQTISKWESGQTTPELEKLIKLSELFEITVDELIKGDKDISNNISNEIDRNDKENKDNRTVHKNKRFSKFKKIILLVLLAVIICYIIIVIGRLKIIYAAENILIDNISKYTYLEIDKTEYNESSNYLDSNYSSLAFWIYNSGTVNKEKIRVRYGGEENKKIILFQEYDEADVATYESSYKCIEIDEENLTYKILESLPSEYVSMFHYSDIHFEYQKYYNEKVGYHSIESLLMAMDLRIKIAKVNNGGMTGYYISDRNKIYSDSCSLIVDTLTKTIVLEKDIFDEQTNNRISSGVYRYKYSENAVSEEDVTIPDLAEYTLVE